MRMRWAIASALLLVLTLIAASASVSGCRRPESGGGEAAHPDNPAVVAPPIAVTPESQAVAASARIRIWTVPGPDGGYAWLEYEGQSGVRVLASGHVMAGTTRIEVPAQMLPMWHTGCQPIVWLDATRVLFFGHILADTATDTVRGLPVGCDIIDTYQLSPDRERLAVCGTLSDKAGGRGFVVYDFATDQTCLAKREDMNEFDSRDQIDTKLVAWVDDQTLLFDHPSKGQPAIWKWTVSGGEAVVWETGACDPRARGDGRYVLYSHYPTGDAPAMLPTLTDLVAGTESAAPSAFWPLFDVTSDIVGGPSAGEHGGELMYVGSVRDGKIVVSEITDRDGLLVAFSVSPRGVTYSILHYADDGCTTATYATQTTLAPADLQPAGPEDTATFTFYDNGTTRSLTGLAIKRLVEDAAGDTRCRLGPDWDQRPAHAARYFTMNLLGIKDQRTEAWGQTAAGGGNGIWSGDGAPLGDYAGQLDVDRTSETASVHLRTAGKKAYLISLARPWPGGPWLVIKVDEIEYVSPP